MKKLLSLLVLVTSALPAMAQPVEDQDHGRPVAAVAKELGVTPEQFREAFKKVHPAGPGEHPTQAQREANRKALSTALHVSPEKLDQVMDKYRPGGRGDNGPPMRADGGGPGGAGEHQSGPGGPGGNNGPGGPGGPGGHGGHFAAMSKELGLSEEQVREAFHKVGPPKGGPPQPGQPPTAEQEAHRKALADALHVSPEKLDKVMDKYRPKPPGSPPNDGGGHEHGG